ncbi:MAG: HAMP domain-containing histidine kinase [Candidatus Fournierella pullistercoris]|uniref:histidine kinase n=1 Tax=Candidatus Allofournierella pullistercoris TaxID=2838597 RepID=A0A948T3G9_9FIRM|nr:HAMP domain-containing histidine kinase [Candidatus Fournierella pullistercoris]
MSKPHSPKLKSSLYSYIVFFLIIAFAVACCMSLFLTVLAQQMDVQWSVDNLGFAAWLTFANVMVITLLFTLLYHLRRSWAVERALGQITKATEKMMQGDFSVQIPSSVAERSDAALRQIIDCMNQMSRELSCMETLRTDFVSNVSHEIKTPLSVIQNYATLLSQPGLTQTEQKEYAGSILRATRRLSDLVSNILRLSRLENQQVKPEKVCYDLSEQLCECLLDFEEVWHSDAYQLVTHLEEQVMVISDPDWMSLVWNNLISNAIKFTPPGGRVSVSVQRKGDKAVVTVQDTGCGISWEEQRHIFDKFYQADTSRACLGNGLGLALVKKILEMTGCTIRLESQVGQGSVFTVEHPLNPS